MSARQAGQQALEASTRKPRATHLRGIRIDGGEVRLLQVRVVVQNLVLRHAASKHVEHVPDGHPQTADTRLARAQAGYRFDPGKIGPIRRRRGK